DELVSVVAVSCKKTLRDDDRQIDTAHLLHSLVESDPEVRAVFDGPQVARLLGYLVQRSIGYGLRWQIGVEDTGVVAGVPGRPGWSPVAARAMTQAYDRAVLRGAGAARSVDLLAVLVAATGSRAVEVLAKVGVDRDVVARRLAEVGEGRVEGRVVSGDGGC
ncbi:Clp protease N-terminal domain-containing protein, partial [Streptomyces stelliscabiei]|uniref:Clp protease N-terminal domain-containing protein n=1 Tax=Streptomyces stelliscabiei TaxID=146820 RepID=UPI0029A4A338